MSEVQFSPEAARRREVFFMVHKDLPREGPGNSACTRRAYAAVTELPTSPRILDIGAGPGLQTIELTRVAPTADIVALDLHPQYLDQLRLRAVQEGVSQRIRTIQGSMFSIALPEKSFDVLWAEGAIYIIGFEEGLRSWQGLLKPRGYLAASHISWLKTNVPDEVSRFWNDKYPAITTIDLNLSIADEAGYETVDYFSLPQEAWWDDYYDPLEKRLNVLRGELAGDQVAHRVIEDVQQEIDLYRRHSDAYGYVFYIVRKKV